MIVSKRTLITPSRVRIPPSGGQRAQQQGWAWAHDGGWAEGARHEGQWEQGGGWAEGEELGRAEPDRRRLDERGRYVGTRAVAATTGAATADAPSRKSGTIQVDHSCRRLTNGPTASSS